MLQEKMIERVRELCVQDARIEGAFMFGSFATGEGDRFSDIEFILFFKDESFPNIDQEHWVAQIETLELYFADDYGHHTAIFTNLVRGEFHFEPASRIPIIETWQGYAWFPSLESTIIVDRTGAIERYLRPFVGNPPDRNTTTEVMSVAANFINLVLFGINVLARGEFARAWALLSDSHSNLLKLVRLAEGTTEHWPTPSKGLEKDISVGAYGRYRSCTADLDQARLWHAYRETWKWGCELMKRAARNDNISLPTTIIEELTKRIETGIDA